MKSKKIAVFLSLLFPGFGHLYIGKYIDAVVFIAGAGILWYALFLRGYFLMMSADLRYYLILVALVIVYFYSIVNAYRKTK